MIASFQRRPFVVSLAVIAVVLAAVIGLELFLGTGHRSALTSATGKKARAVEGKLLPPIVASAPEQAYPETAARPLFLPTRRPAPEAASQDKKSFVQGQFVLQGVTMAGDMRIAMLREKANGRIHRVERGREVNGIQVVEIQPEMVTLGMGGEREVLSLQVQRPSGAPSAAAPAGPFAATAPAPGAQQPVMPGATTPSGMPMPPGQQPQIAPMGPRVGATPAQTPPGAAGTPNPLVREPVGPMTPEELLARRRARRNQQTQ